MNTFEKIVLTSLRDMMKLHTSESFAYTTKLMDDIKKHVAVIDRMLEEDRVEKADNSHDN